MSQSRREAALLERTHAHLDPVASEAERLTESWTRRELDRWSELLGSAPSELQQELLCRALAARHSLPELEEFAEDIRLLPDHELYTRCSLRSEVQSASRLSVQQRLRAEADPLIAFALSATHASGDATDAATADTSAGQRTWTDVQPPSTSRTAPAPSAPGVPSPWLADVLNLIVRPLGVSYREESIAGSSSALGKVLHRMATALRSGLPVPGLLVDARGEPLQPVLFLQCDDSGGRRLFQLHGLFSRETVWVDANVLQEGEPLPLEHGDGATLRLVCLPLPLLSSRSGVS